MLVYSAMKVNGTVLLTRKALVTRQFGSEAWHGLFRDVALAHSCFRQPITLSSMIPLPEFLAFHDELVRRFYPDGREALLDLGAQAARWAHVEGPLKRFVRNVDITALVETIPKLWPRYFAETESRSEATLCAAGVEFRVRDLPAWHPYFEHLVIGYMKEMLELYCANPVWTKRLTAGRGTAFGYLLATDPVSVGNARSTASVEGSRSLRQPSPITNRELEVLRLVGAGKTNREIGLILRISEKTVQHHVSHSYNKLGLYSRAGAATWLAEHDVGS
jgi:DNA-binding CsgD family transcriptional regulator